MNSNFQCFSLSLLFQIMCTFAYYAWFELHDPLHIIQLVSIYFRIFSWKSNHDILVFPTVIILLIHLQLVFSYNWIGILCTRNIALFCILSKGMSHLFYPLCGWIAEVFFTKFRMIKWSFIVMLISSVTMSISGILFIVTTKAHIHSAAKHLLQSPEVREERLQKLYIIIITTVEPQPVYNGHPWEFGPTKVLRQILLYHSFFSLFYFYV